MQCKYYNQSTGKHLLESPQTAAQGRVTTVLIFEWQSQDRAAFQPDVRPGCCRAPTHTTSTAGRPQTLHPVPGAHTKDSQRASSQNKTHKNGQRALQQFNWNVKSKHPGWTFHPAHNFLPRERNKKGGVFVRELSVITWYSFVCLAVW